MQKISRPARQLTRGVRGFFALLSGHLSIKRSPQLFEVIVEWLNEPRWSTNLMMGALALTIRIRRVARSARLACRTYLSRLAFRLKHEKSDKVGAGQDQASQVKSMLCPTRSRADKVQKFVKSVHRTCANPANVELLFYVDDDDPQIDKYVSTIERMKLKYDDFKVIELVIGPPISVSRSWNVLAMKCRGNLLMMANDDQLYVDYGWDYHLDRYYSDSKDDIFAMFFEDGQYPPDGGDFPIVSRRWYESL